MWIMLLWWQAFRWTNHVVWILICYRTMHNEWKREKDGFEWSQAFHVNHTEWMCFTVGRLQQNFTCCQCFFCRKSSPLHLTSFFSILQQLLRLFFCPAVITVPVVLYNSSLFIWHPVLTLEFIHLFILVLFVSVFGKLTLHFSNAVFSVFQLPASAILWCTTVKVSSVGQTVTPYEPKK